MHDLNTRKAFWLDTMNGIYAGLRRSQDQRKGYTALDYT